MDLKTETEINEAVIPPLPSFMQEGEILQKEKGAFYGTAFHRVMELLDLQNVPWNISEKELSVSSGKEQPAVSESKKYAETLHLKEFITDEFRRMLQSGRLEEAQAKIVRKTDVLQLLQSPLGMELVQASRAGTLHREAQFVMSVPSDKIGLQKTSAEKPDDAGEVIVQGVIDVWFEKDGGLVLVDYKTDHVPEEDGAGILKDRYTRQLDFYQMALEEASGKKVVRRCIYSTTLKRAFDV